MPLYSTSLDPISGVDPQWDILKPTYDIRIAQAQAAAKKRQDESQNQYNQSIYDLGNRIQDTRRNTLSSLEGRGVLASGETQNRMAQIAEQEIEAQRRAGSALTGAQSSASDELDRLLKGVGTDREMAVQAALDRQKQNAIDAWNTAFEQAQRDEQNRLLQAALNRPVAQPRTVVVNRTAPAPVAAGPSQADIARWNAALAANQSRAALPTLTRTGGAR